MSSRRLRRLHATRIKRRILARLPFSFCSPQQLNDPHWVAVHEGKTLHSRPFCSCSMCASPRQWHGNSPNGHTLQERRAALREGDQE